MKARIALSASPRPTIGGWRMVGQFVWWFEIALMHARGWAGLDWLGLELELSASL